MSFLRLIPASRCASTSTGSSSRCLSSASTSRLPRTSQSPSEPKPSSATSSAHDLAVIVDSVLLRDDVQSTEAQAFLLANLLDNSVISPRALSPASLLTPYPARPDFALAHPLGPPTSAARTHDPFVRLGMSPLASPLNPFLRTEFCTSMGKIKSRGKTGLQRGSQRQMGKAVRRARAMGIVAVFGESLPGQDRRR